MQVIKRNNDKHKFDSNKIVNAILKASTDNDRISKSEAMAIAKTIARSLNRSEIDVESIQDMVEDALIDSGHKNVAKNYIRYRYKRGLVREFNTTDRQIFDLVNGDSEYWNSENSNKDAKIVTTQRDYIAGITNTDIARRFLFPKEAIKAHDEGNIHIHDMDYAADNVRTNCCLLNLEDMLDNGTVLNGIRIDSPKRFLTACTIATQIILAVSASQYGGTTVSLTHLAPYVRKSYYIYLNKYKTFGMSDDDADKLARIDTSNEIRDGVQTFNYQVNSMACANGQSPFLSVCMYLGETSEYKKELAAIIKEFLIQRIRGMKNEKGAWITVAFPKLLYVLEEDNVHPDSPYWYLSELAAKCTAKRMVPDYISEKIMKKLKINRLGQGDCYPCMGCRSFLTPDRTNGNIARAMNYSDDRPKYYGRFNCGVCTINLADLALSSGGDIDKFWKLFDERTELCHDVLKIRLKRIASATSDVAPVLWQHGAFARLEQGEKLDKLVHGSYATVSLGYAALYECVKYMTGFSHTQEKGRAFALAVMKALNDKCAAWKHNEDIDYSIYGSPIESTTYKFAKCLKKRFGDDVFVKLDGEDRNFVTNSYHVPVFDDISAFDKLSKEAEFQALSPGGAISYVETADLTHNIEAVEQVMKYIYENIMYAELNTKSDYCQVCGYDGEIKIIDEGGTLHYRCPNCGNTNTKKMNVARRVCGYVSSTVPNQGKLDEFVKRKVHIDTVEA